MPRPSSSPAQLAHRPTSLEAFAGDATPLGRMHDIRRRLQTLNDEIVAFWWPRAYDAEHGGFHGALDREGRPCAPTGKTLVQQARHLWSLGFYLARRGAPPTSAPASCDALSSLAQGTRAFLDRFRDHRDDRYVWELDRAGELRDSTKVLYGQAFAIFGLSQYGALGNVEALDAALRCFDAIESRSHDAHHGGYHQFGDPQWVTGGACKDTNTHIHLMEAFTALYDATGEPRVRARLAELVELVCTRLQQPEGHVHPFFERDFRLFGRPRVSYGHDIETAWLLVDAARALRWDEQAVSGASLRMATHALDFGFDRDAGGLFDEGVPRGPVTAFEKLWWAQFEALAGLFWLYRSTGDAAYLTYLEETLDWLEGPARDETFGEWYFAVLPDGALDGHGTGKGNIWKTNYHDLRATLLVSDWIDAWLRKEPGEASPHRHGSVRPSRPSDPNRESQP